MVLDRRIDATAIDSTVLEWEVQRDPGLANQIRVIETRDPSPILPWMVAHSVSPEMEKAWREAFAGMHEQAEGREALAAGQMDRFVRVEDGDYDAIREKARQAQGGAVVGNPAAYNSRRSSSVRFPLLRVA